MPNLGEIIDLCEVALGATDATTEDQIRWGIVRAIDSYKSQRFSWNRIKWELTTTSAEAFYTSIGQVDTGSMFTANEIFALDSAFYIRDSVKYPVSIVDFESTGFGLDTTEDTGKPYAIAIGASEFLVYPTPDDAYVLQGVAVADVNKTVGAYTKIESDTATSATNPWLDRADRMIQCKALAEVFLFYRRDPKWAAVYENAANQEFTRHVQDYERREGAGRVRGYYDRDDRPGYWVF